MKFTVAAESLLARWVLPATAFTLPLLALAAGGVTALWAALPVSFLILLGCYCWVQLRRAVDTRAAEPESRFVECRSWHGTAHHIRARDSKLALCGYDPLDDRSPITAESYLAALPRQHAGWHYCADCGQELLRLSAVAAG